jgi:hypothetical protein
MYLYLLYKKKYIDIKSNNAQTLVSNTSLLTKSDIYKMLFELTF